MCECTSCKYTDNFADKGFAAWPRGEPKGKRKSDAEYSAHARHCGANGLAKPYRYISRPPVYPINGTPQTDGRAWYHFPGGQIGECRHEASSKFTHTRQDEERPPATDDTAEYVAAFLAANHLTGVAPAVKAKRPRKRATAAA